MAENFTPGQKAQLEKRDLDPNRQSRLSVGERDEVKELDELFSSEQMAELDKRAENRDLYRPRKSRFSVGEQIELDTTARDIRDEGIHRAKNLQFNDIQQRELAYRFRKRLLPIVAYLIMVIAIAGAFAVVNSHERSNHAAIITLCQHQTQVDCKTLFK